MTPEPDATARELIAEALRIRACLDKGRRQAHRNRRSEAAAKDARLRNHWQQFKRLGWSDGEILDVLAERYRVKRDTVIRRARKLKLLSDA